METMADRIKSVLGERDMTPTDLIRQKVLSKAGVYLLLNGTTQADKVRATTSDRLCKALDVNWRWLSTGKGPRNAEPSASASGPSQAGRPDFSMMASAVEVLRHYLDLSGEPPERIADPVYLEIMYEAVEAFGGEVRPDNVLDITKWAAKRVRGAQNDAGHEVQRVGRAAGG